jgi:hypothetical protein
MGSSSPLSEAKEDTTTRPFCSPQIVPAILSRVYPCVQKPNPSTRAADTTKTGRWGVWRGRMVQPMSCSSLLPCSGSLPGPIQFQPAQPSPASCLGARPARDSFPIRPVYMRPPAHLYPSLPCLQVSRTTPTTKSNAQHPFHPHRLSLSFTQRAPSSIDSVLLPLPPPPPKVCPVWRITKRHYHEGPGHFGILGAGLQGPC